MAGVTWRQHRIALAAVAVLLGALAVWLWIIGTPLHHAYAAAIACHPASSAACQTLAGAFNGTNDHLLGATSPGGVFLQLVPVLIGAFAGAPALARELETGTFRYAWTQGFGRWRWALAKLGLLAAGLAAATGAVGVLVAWYYQPYFAPGSRPGCLAPHGYTQWTSYQPATRFWPFQWVEGGWLLALSALLVAATIWLVRRRAA